MTSGARRGSGWAAVILTSMALRRVSSSRSLAMRDAASPPVSMAARHRTAGASRRGVQGAVRKLKLGAFEAFER